ncbi:putative protein phosphatase-1 regulatory subunit 7 alpha2 protein [Gregarina niphandrodes]|uniref:Leucine rich repeat protein n=1 Tax=Gregarina niphandrodes TaxID=110365 RepID=A0A023B522_GRENI|nr:putative protein phosphatase-1 regulatory subunit 7 alpha2 protein [Gregarina niphandrodes]EZG57974.1 putative protein phosphatase-1 regulatory subunit 7 alpha2 protein [Gregarina niphandrodes]|eukprot:XP_011131003.1 putative protein phosphatase-1 regulatory subunit 7 alpha2 protein [Gregarina niphandrodes]
MPFGGTPQADETDGDSSSDVPPVAVERIEAEDVPDNETVYLTMRRIKKIENIDVTKCRSLSVISCILEDMRGVQGMINLEVLELYQNQIKKIECLEGMTKLE